MRGGGSFRGFLGFLLGRQAVHAGKEVVQEKRLVILPVPELVQQHQCPDGEDEENENRQRDQKLFHGTLQGEGTGWGAIHLRRENKSREEECARAET